MELNTKGRVIHKGPRGGEYVLEKGKKVYKFVKLAPSSIPKTNVNTKGRVIHKGARGGYYVIEKGKKIYKFTRAKGAPLALVNL